MKLKLSKKLFSSLTAVALLFGTTAVSANTMSIVDSNNLLNSDILIDPINGPTTFSMDINVALDSGITAGQAYTDVLWNPNVLTLESVSTLLGPGLNVASSTLLPANTGATQLSMLDLVVFPVMHNTLAMTGSFTWATLTFSYNGPGDALIELAPVVSSENTGLGWSKFGSTDDILFGTVNNATVSVSAVPVPPAFLLFASAIAGLSISGRRKA